MSKNIRLETHITDIVNFIKLEGLQNFTAVAHSYGGWPISGVAERAGDAIGSIVFPDAFMPAHEDKELDLNSPQSSRRCLRQYNLAKFRDRLRGARAEERARDRQKMAPRQGYPSAHCSIESGSPVPATASRGMLSFAEEIFQTLISTAFMTLVRLLDGLPSTFDLVTMCRSKFPGN